MNIQKVTGLALTALALNFGILADAQAAGVSMKCEVRSGRSKASVDGFDLSAGLYRASLKSGTAAAVLSKLPAQRPVNGQAEFDFDSNSGDVAAGATRISPTYIQGRSAVGTIYRLNNLNQLVFVARATASCRAK